MPSIHVSLFISINLISAQLKEDAISYEEHIEPTLWCEMEKTPKESPHPYVRSRGNEEKENDSPTSSLLLKQVVLKKVINVIFITTNSFPI